MTDVAATIPSGSTNGRPIKVAATATPGTLIHTAVAGAVDMDEVWIWGTNTSVSDVKLTIEFGGVTSPDDLIEMTIPAEDGLYLVVPGNRVNGGLEIRAFAATGDVINITSNINLIKA